MAFMCEASMELVSNEWQCGICWLANVFIQETCSPEISILSLLVVLSMAWGIEVQIL